MSKTKKGSNKCLINSGKMVSLTREDKCTTIPYNTEFRKMED